MEKLFEGHYFYCNIIGHEKIFVEQFTQVLTFMYRLMHGFQWVRVT